MLPEYTTRANLGVGLGLILQLAVRFMPGVGAGSMAMDVLALLLMAGGVALLIWGLGMYAQSKGYRAILGFLGLLSVIGLIVLVCLPDKMKDSARRGFPVIPRR